MKKLLILFLAPILLFACGDSDDNESTSPLTGTWSHVFRSDKKDYYEELLTFSIDGSVLLVSNIKTSSRTNNRLDTISSFVSFKIDQKKKTVHILDNYNYYHSTIGQHNPEEPGFYNYQILPNDTLRLYFKSVNLINYERKYIKKK